VPDTTYILAVLAITFMITYSLRAVPFAVLGTLRESTLAQELAAWMPVGILSILAVAAFRGSLLALPQTTVPALIASPSPSQSTSSWAGGPAQRRDRHRNSRSSVCLETAVSATRTTQPGTEPFVSAKRRQSAI
jgi:branched-subunit amino acid transport protein AzlD